MGAENGSNGRSNGVLSEKWLMMLVALVAGTAGGFGFRQVDPTAFTRQEATELIARVRMTETRLERLPPRELISAVDRLGFRIEQLERHVDALSKEIKGRKNEAQSEGR